METIHFSKEERPKRYKDTFMFFTNLYGDRGF